MKTSIHKIALGGGCHWCTEAVFQSLRGVDSVAQGWVASTGAEASFSEAVVIHFDAEEIPLEVLLLVHLHTHASTSQHSMRGKYRSAVYSFSDDQHQRLEEILRRLCKNFKKPLVTKVYPFRVFKPSREAIQNYYYKNPEKPFCKAYIDPKLKLLLSKFGKYVKNENESSIDGVIPSQA